MTHHPAPQRSLAPRNLRQLGLRVLARLYGATDGPRACDVPEAQRPLSPCR